MRIVRDTSWLHRAAAVWAVCSYEDRAGEWAWVQRQARGALVLVANASSAVHSVGHGQQRAKLHHRARLIQQVWHRALNGAAEYDLIWLLDEDISFRSFDLAGFLLRWMCAFGPAGPPVIAQPTLREGDRFGQAWPLSDDTYRRCLTGELGARYGGEEACFLRHTLALRSDWIEQWAPLMDARFVAWFLKQETTRRVVEAQLRWNSDFGADEVWCGAAAEWLDVSRPAVNKWGGSSHRTRDRLVLEKAEGSRPQTPERRVPCAVVTLPIVHDDTRTQGNSNAAQARIMDGFKTLHHAGLRWPQSLINMGKCRGRNCTPHRWWRYAPTPRWPLPVSEASIEKIRACVTTKLACGLHQSFPPPSGIMDGSGSTCEGLADVWWDEND